MLYYNLADQGFKASPRASVGIYNVSVQMALQISRGRPCTLMMNAASDIPDILKGIPIQRVNGSTGGFQRFRWDQWGLYGAVKTEPADWLFLPKGFSSFVRKPPCRLAVYVHDVVYTYWRRNYPGYRSRMLHTYFQWSLKASLRYADVVFTNSMFTADEIRRFSEDAGLKKLPPIVQAGIGFDHLTAAPCEEERSGILVYVSSWPHKATPVLLDMLKRWQVEAGFTEPVYLVGALPQPMDFSEYTNWQECGILPEADYRSMLGSVRCSIFNSEYEGFGMPPGESVIQGAVPVYSSIPTLDEVMDGIGFSYDNAGYESFADALNSALRAPRDVLTGWREDFLEKYNWSKVAGTVIEALG